MQMGRRQFLATSSALAATASFAPTLLAHTTGAGTPQRYPDKTWEVLDDRFKPYYVFNTPLERQWTGGLWLEGPAWNAVGRYAVFSDIPRAQQMRWDEASGEVSVLREGVGHSNGNTFDRWGRLVACEHSPARVVRYEWDGGVTILADQFQGKRLNAPNDLVALDNGGILFTDPGYGAHVDYEGHKRELELDPAIYYIDDDLDEPRLFSDELYKPNGIALSADKRTLYASDTAPSHYPDQPATISRWRLAEDGTAQGERETVVSSKDEGYDGIALDQDGNIWAGVSGGEGKDGVSVFTPDGERLARILLPEVCANLCFVGEDRNRLLMTASQSIYTLYTGARGA
ncbi:SMP-30/gluconolactonase/LRE family protein [Chromohalobacter nigrandesensis]|uniref:SMP-30/gluconolactonase/LRE family protein n=1 Tax=Chromohalobacter nigrandesensis TaxID=119863 RepID=UPI001FF585B7|nr:SMP-30/gluconolactonase/LRE family protein [Chromohalobacter nigrandesensis]MCK0746089.1 SMP-30/gluconolactonase/LRE family protein [Chromohalobacter nigrandesensis]